MLHVSLHLLTFGLAVRARELRLRRGFSTAYSELFLLIDSVDKLVPYSPALSP